jgi:hypothetical protein
MICKQKTKLILDYGRGHKRGHKRKKSSDTLIHTITGNSSLKRYEIWRVDIKVCIKNRHFVIALV